MLIRERGVVVRSIIYLAGRFFGGMTLVEVNPEHISRYKVQKRKDGVSPRTINYELTLMSHAYRIAWKEWEWVEENPVSKVSKEKVHNIVERWLSVEEERRLL